MDTKFWLYILAFFCINYFLFQGWKKSKVEVILKKWKIKLIFSKKENPLGYWASMLFYVAAWLLFSFLILDKIIEF